MNQNKCPSAVKADVKIETENRVTSIQIFISVEMRKLVFIVSIFAKFMQSLCLITLSAS